MFFFLPLSFIKKHAIDVVSYSSEILFMLTVFITLDYPQRDRLRERQQDRSTCLFWDEGTSMFKGAEAKEKKKPRL